MSKKEEMKRICVMCESEKRVKVLCPQATRFIKTTYGYACLVSEKEKQKQVLKIMQDLQILPKRKLL